jgi:hypothetical protein
MGWGDEIMVTAQARRDPDRPQLSGIPAVSRLSEIQQRRSDAGLRLYGFPRRAGRDLPLRPGESARRARARRGHPRAERQAKGLAEQGLGLGALAAPCLCKLRELRLGPDRARGERGARGRRIHCDGQHSRGRRRTVRRRAPRCARGRPASRGRGARDPRRRHLRRLYLAGDDRLRQLHINLFTGGKACGMRVPARIALSHGDGRDLAGHGRVGRARSPARRRMSVSVYGYPQPGKPKSERILVSFARGAGGFIRRELELEDGAGAAFYGIAGLEPLFRAARERAAASAGDYGIYLDNSYFDVDARSAISASRATPCSARRARRTSARLDAARPPDRALAPQPAAAILIVEQSDYFMRELVGWPRRRRRPGARTSCASSPAIHGPAAAAAASGCAIRPTPPELARRGPRRRLGGRDALERRGGRGRSSPACRRS